MGTNLSPHALQTMTQAHDIYSGIHTDEHNNQDEDVPASRFEELDAIQEESGEAQDEGKEDEQKHRERIAAESIEGVKVQRAFLLLKRKSRTIHELPCSLPGGDRSSR